MVSWKKHWTGSFFSGVFMFRSGLGVHAVCNYPKGEKYILLALGGHRWFFNVCNCFRCGMKLFSAFKQGRKLNARCAFIALLGLPLSYVVFSTCF